MAKRFSREAESKDVENLFELLGPGSMVYAVGHEIRNLVSGSQSEDEPSTRQPVQHQGVFGYSDWMVQGSCEHRGPKPERGRCLEDGRAYDRG